MTSRTPSRRDHSRPRRAAERPVSAPEGAYVPAHAGSRRSARAITMGPRRRSVGKVVALVLAVLVVAVAALSAAEVVLNAGKVHYGVKVAGVDVGGMTRAEAAQTLERELGSRLSEASVRAVPDSDTVARLEANVVGEGGVATADGAADASAAGDAAADPSAEGAGDSSVEGQDAQPASPDSLSWTFSAADLGARIDTESLVQEALAIGDISEPTDILEGVAQRVRSWLGQVDLPAEVAFDDEALSAALAPLDQALGVTMVNYTFAMSPEGAAGVVAGRAGEAVDAEAFARLAADALLGETTSTVAIPLAEVPVDIDEAEAQAAADAVNDAVFLPVTIKYAGQSWEITSAQMGTWVVPVIEGAGESARIGAALDEARAYEGIQQVLGSVAHGTATNATFDVRSGVPVVTGGTTGIGPDIMTGVGDLEALLFGDGAGAGTEAGEAAATRVIALEEGIVDPAVTVEDAQAMGVNELIVTYQLNYGSGGGSNREKNIERCLDTLNGSLVAPGENWNWNEVVGRCDESTGYLPASVIIGSDVVQSAGGGICNVATAVFNAAYEAGLPIVERTNHSIYQPNYPLGRDAAVSWEYPTLVFTNDTARYILVTAAYDGTDLSISIWGTNEHRTVESVNSEWDGTEETGRSITNYRTVYAADGTVLREDSFYSYFPPVEKEEEEAPAEEAAAEGETGGEGEGAAADA